MAFSTQQIPAGYKQTDVGVIPEDWSTKKFGQLLKVKHGKGQKEIELVDGKYPILATGGEIGRTNTSIYEKPSILIGRKGTIDRPQIMFTPFWTVDTLFYTEIKNGVDPMFLFYKCKMIDWYLYNEASGVPSLNAKTIESIIISIPSNVDEQKTISSTISDIDSLISKLDQLIQKKKSIKQGAMQELLTGKRRLPGFGGEWESVRLGDTLQYEQPTEYIVTNTEYSETTGVPVLTAGKSFILGYSDEVSNYFDNLPVIIFDDFTTASKYVNFEFKVKSSAMKMLLPRTQKNNLRFVFEKMQLIDFPLGDHKRRWISEYQDIELSMPGYDEQCSITEILESMNSEITLLQRRRNKYQHLKQGMMQQLLTGKIRLVN